MSAEPTYAQAGEDRIMWFLFQGMKLDRPIRYLDIGAAFPIDHNNTYLLYSKGASGVLIEADPAYGAQYAEHRPRDIHLNAACVPQNMVGDGSITFYIASNPGWSTVSQQHVALAQRIGKGETKRQVTVPARTINSIMSEYFPNEAPDLMSMDIEGVDRLVLEDLDFGRFRPKAIIVENEGGQRVHDARMLSVGYAVFGYTFVNSIYVDASVMRSLSF